MTEKQVTVDLTPAEALVLFEWLARVDSSHELSFEDPSEQQVLWILEGKLERLLAEPLAANYRELLTAAREKVRAAHG
jgi:hypothetical protein